MSTNKFSTFQRINKGLEYFWLAMTLLTAVLATYFIMNEGYDEAKWYLLFPLLTMAMFLMRRGLRKKFEASFQKQQEEENKGNRK